MNDKKKGGDKPKDARNESQAPDQHGQLRTVLRDFPGPRAPGVALRVALDKTAFAELIAHTKESLDAEVCGVLAGEICEDDEGVFVHGRAIVRGTSTRHGSAHVTFTQETWNTIHQTLERNFPRLQIVGWYHSHPGFGVVFSEMDLFIQKNFFSGPAQIAMLNDPLCGDMAVCVNQAAGPALLDRFWVDGREHRCRTLSGSQTGAAAPPGGTGDAAAAHIGNDALEARLNQLLRAIDEQRTATHRLLLSAFLTIGTMVALWIGYGIYTHFRSLREPPQLSQYVPVPIRIGDQTVLLGVGIMKWEVPPELNAIYLEMARLKKEAEEKAAQETPAAPDGSTAGTPDAAGAR